MDSWLDGWLDRSQKRREEEEEEEVLGHGST